MPVCAVKLCRNHAGNCDSKKGITFHRFPADSVLTKLWTDIIKKTRGDEYWKPHKTAVVCSDHFPDDDFTKKGVRRRLLRGAVPSKRLFLSGLDEESSSNKQQDQIVTNLEIETKPSCSKETVNDDDDDDDDDPTISQNDFSDSDSIFDSPREVKLRKKLRDKIKQAQKHRAVMESLRNKNNHLKKRNAYFKHIIVKLKKQRLRKCIRCNLILPNYEQKIESQR